MWADFRAFSAAGEETNARKVSILRARAWVAAIVALCNSARLTTWLCAKQSWGIMKTTASVLAVATRTNCRMRKCIAAVLLKLNCSQRFYQYNRTLESWDVSKVVRGDESNLRHPQKVLSGCRSRQPSLDVYVERDSGILEDGPEAPSSNQVHRRRS